MVNPSPHDAYFKAVFSQPENAVGELKAVLPPALLARLDLASARVVPGSFVDESLTTRHTDLLYEVRLAGSPAFLYVLFEHQSSVDPLLVVRLLVYIARIWDDWLRRNEGATRVPPIVPLVLYHGASAWTAATQLVDVIDLPADALTAVRERLPTFRFVLDDLTQRTDQDLRAREVAVLGRLALLLLRHLREARSDATAVDALLRSTADLLDLLPNRDRVLSFRYILEVAERPAAAVEAALRGVAKPNVLEDVMTAAEQLRREGEQRALCRTLLRQLRARFGPVPADVESRVVAADMAALELWTDRVVTAATVDDVFKA
jgi:hypothetical protein